jgi:hypothetical protein
MAATITCAGETAPAHWGNVLVTGTSTVDYACGPGNFTVQVWQADTSGTGTGMTFDVSYDDGTAATPAPPGPQPTHAPFPTSTPPPSVPLDPGAFPYSSDCLHATRTTGTESGAAYVACTWWANHPDSTGNTPGPLFLDFQTWGTGTHVDDGGGQTTFRLAADGGPVPEPQVQGPWMAVPTGATAISLAFGINYGSLSLVNTYSGHYFTAVEFRDGAGKIRRAVEQTAEGAKSPTLFYLTRANIPAGTVSLRAMGGCFEGSICWGAYGGDTSAGRFVRMDAFALTWWMGATGGDPPDGCTVLTQPGYTNMCKPGAVTDPTTGLPYCGPLSGDCSGSKPFLQPVYVPTCGTPGNFLDVVGWLSYLACLTQQLIATVWNTAVGVFNAFVDLLWPGQLAEQLVALDDAWHTRAVFAWLDPILTAVSDALSGGGTSPASLTDFTFGGHTVPMSHSVDEVTDMLAPYRTVFLGFVVLSLILKGRDRIVSTFDGGSFSQGPE